MPSTSEVQPLLMLASDKHDLETSHAVHAECPSLSISLMLVGADEHSTWGCRLQRSWLRRAGYQTS